MSFCQNCGKPVDGSLKFCTNCGFGLSPLDGSVPAASSHATEAQPMAGSDPGTPGKETVIGVIGGLEIKRSFLKSEPINLVVTGTRTLCVPVASLLKAALIEAEREAKAEGKWFIGQLKLKAEVTKACNFSTSFLKHSPDDILREYPASIIIPHTDLVRITIKHRNLDFEGEDITTTVEDWPMVIKTGKGEYSLVARVDPVQQFRLNTEIDKILGERIKVLF